VAVSARRRRMDREPMISHNPQFKKSEEMKKCPVP